MKDYARIATKIRETPWMITEQGLDVILGIFNDRIKNGKLTDAELSARLSNIQANEGRNDAYDSYKGVGILQLFGPIFGKANLMTQMSGATSLEEFRQDFRNMMDDDQISSIVLQIDSPGGSSEMVDEVAQEIFEANKTKPVYAIADTTMGSAAYYIGSQAESLYATPSGSVGSIGVYTVHENRAGEDAQQGIEYTYVSAGPHKVEGNPHEPLSTEARGHMQEVVDEVYDEFLTAVGRGRGISKESVQQNYGGGRMFTAKKALDKGMVDGIMPFEQLVTTLANKPASKVYQVTMPAYAANGMAEQIQKVVVGNATKSSTAGVVLNFDTNTVTPIQWPTSTGTNLESKEWEHSEPGTGSPPQPREDEDGSDDSAIKSGSRRDPLPVPYGDPGAPRASAFFDKEGNFIPISREEGTVLDSDTLAQLNELFGLKADADAEQLLSIAKTQVGELNALKDATNMLSEEQRLKTEFPGMWEQHQKMLNESQDTKAKEFAATVSKFKKPMQNGEFEATSTGLSALAMQTVAETHKKFATGTGTLEDFEGAIKAITEGGTLQLGELGSAVPKELQEIDTSNPQGIQKARYAFAEKIAEIQAEDKLELSAAFKVAAERYPDLAAAYRVAAPA